MLRTRCILLPPSSDDGFRVSVMSRHTLEDGTTPDPRILPGAYHAHWPRLGPPPKLIGAYVRREIAWDAFEREFLLHLGRDPTSSAALRLIASIAKGANVTLLCIEDESERDARGKLRCHRRLLAEACAKLDPAILSDIR